MKNLENYPEPYLFAGAVLRFTGEYPFDKTPVHFMLCDYPAAGADRAPFALYCVSGYHAGSLEYVFPKEALADDRRAIRTQWLKTYWNTKVYDGCTAEAVEVLEAWQE